MARKRKLKGVRLLTPERLPEYLWGQGVEAEKKMKKAEREDDDDMVNFWSGVGSGLGQAAVAAEGALETLEGGKGVRVRFT